MRVVLGAARRHARVLRASCSASAGGRSRGRHGGRARRRRAAPPRAGGIRGGGRGAVRLLHAGARRRRDRPARRTRTRATTRSARRSPGTSAAAPATRRSSTRFTWRPDDDRRGDDAHPPARPRGESVRRQDAVPKVKGEFAYSSDLHAAGMLWGHTVRSPHPHARIVEIDVSRGVAMPGVHAVLTHEDVPGEKTLRARVPQTSPCSRSTASATTASGRARRGRAPRAGAARGRGDSRRVRGARAGRRTWSARPRWSRSTPTGRRWGTGTATIRVRTSSARW